MQTCSDKRKETQDHSIASSSQVSYVYPMLTLSLEIRYSPISTRLNMFVLARNNHKLLLLLSALHFLSLRGTRIVKKANSLLFKR